jgi:hypothetical protein
MGEKIFQCEGTDMILAAAEVTVCLSGVTAPTSYIAESISLSSLLLVS